MKWQLAEDRRSVDSRKRRKEERGIVVREEAKGSAYKKLMADMDSRKKKEEMKIK